MPQRSFAGSLAETFKSGFASLSLIFLGFLRHGWESLNNEGAGRRGFHRNLPGHIVQCRPHPAIPRQVAPRQSLSTLHRTPVNSKGKERFIARKIATLLYFPDPGPKTGTVESFPLFQHGPGYDQHLGGKLHPHLCPDPPLPRATVQHPVEQPTEILVAGGSNQGRLIKAVATLGIASFGDERNNVFAVFAASVRIEVETRHAQNPVPASKAKGRTQSG